MGTRHKIGPLGGPGARGFTLLELMIVLSLAALILAIGAPSFSEFGRNNRLTAGANDLLASMQLARTEAVLRQIPVSVCASADPASPTPGCDGADFGGWIVFVDVDGDCLRAPAEPLIRQQVPLDVRIGSGASGACASFAATGFLRTVPGVATANRVIYCDERGIGPQAGSDLSAARGIELAPTGRAQITRDVTLVESWGLGCDARG